MTVATEAGVTEETKSRRDEAMEALIAKRETERSEIINEPEPEPKVSTVPMMEFSDDEGNTYRVPATAKFKAKIDGEEQQVEIDKIARSYQKGASADKRLEQASQQLRLAEQKAADLSAKENELSAREQAFLSKLGAAEQKLEEGNLSQDGYNELASKLYKSFLSDDPEEGTKEIADVLNKIASKPQQVDPDKLVNEASQKTLQAIEQREAQRLAQIRDKKRQEANDWFATEYADILENEEMFAAATGLARSKWTDNPNADPMQVAKETGEFFRSLSAKVPSSDGRPKTAPKPVSARAIVGKDELIESREDVLKQMRLSRGQPS